MASFMKTGDGRLLDKSREKVDESVLNDGDLVTCSGQVEQMQGGRLVPVKLPQTRTTSWSGHSSGRKATRASI